jgi:hypothetical protein
MANILHVLEPLSALKSRSSSGKRKSKGAAQTFSSILSLFFSSFSSPHPVQGQKIYAASNFSRLISIDYFSSFALRCLLGCCVNNSHPDFVAFLFQYNNKGKSFGFDE